MFLSTRSLSGVTPMITSIMLVSIGRTRSEMQTSHLNDLNHYNHQRILSHPNQRFKSIQYNKNYHNSHYSRTLALSRRKPAYVGF